MSPLDRIDVLRKVVDMLPVGVWFMDKAGKILYGNLAGQRIWGGARYVGVDQLGEFKGWWVANGRRVEAEEWAAARAIRSGEVSIDEEVAIECFDGARKIILKEINDDHGHAAGDRVLVAISELVREELRGLDRLARYGGEEFLIITPNTSLRKAVTLAERLRTSIATASFDTVARVTCSFGVCQFEGEEDADTLVRRADDLMYKARQSGRSSLVAE
jgi:hypothetical protein